MRITAKSVTIEDEHGQANLVVDAQVPERDRVPPLTSRLLVVEGRVEGEDQYAEIPIIPLIAARPIDRTCWAPCQRLTAWMRRRQQPRRMGCRQRSCCRGGISGRSNAIAAGSARAALERPFCALAAVLAMASDARKPLLLIVLERIEP